MPRWWKSGNTYMYSKTGEGGRQGRGKSERGKEGVASSNPRRTGNLQPQPDPCPSQKWPGNQFFFFLLDHPTQNPAPYSPSAKKWAPCPAPGQVVRPRGAGVGRRVPRCGTGNPTSGRAEEREEERDGDAGSYRARWYSAAAPRRKADRVMK